MLATMLALGAAVPCAAVAATTASPPGHPASSLPSATAYSSEVLPERDGVVAWRTLARVEMVRKGINLVPEFAPEILALDRGIVTVEGFIVPLDAAPAQKRFLLSAVPPECPFCMPAGPEALVEVVARTPVKPGTGPVLFTGRFDVAKDADEGVLYRLTDAVAAKAAAPAGKPVKR